MQISQWIQVMYSRPILLCLHVARVHTIGCMQSVHDDAITVIRVSSPAYDDLKLYWMLFMLMATITILLLTGTGTGAGARAHARADAGGGGGDDDYSML